MRTAWVASSMCSSKRPGWCLLVGAARSGLFWPSCFLRQTFRAGLRMREQDNILLENQGLLVGGRSRGRRRPVRQKQGGTENTLGTAIRNGGPSGGVEIGQRRYQPRLKTASGGRRQRHVLGPFQLAGVRPARTHGTSGVRQGREGPLWARSAPVTRRFDAGRSAIDGGEKLGQEMGKEEEAKNDENDEV